MWKLRYGSVCATVMSLVFSALVSLSAQDPSTLPRIEFNDLIYIGAFRLPEQSVNGDTFSVGGFPLAFNPSRNSLFIGTRKGNVGEVAVPPLVVSNDVTKLAFASFLQGFHEPTEGTLVQAATGGPASISGLLAMGDRVYGSAAIYYDANNMQRVSHYSRSATLSTPGVIGLRQVWTDEHTGFVSGYMAAVPAEWQQKLGGPAITGQCCLPVAWRTSWGPSAFAWNPSDIHSMSKVPATPLLYYPQEHPGLGHWESSNQVFGGTTQVTGVALLAGTRTALYVGRTGTGPFCYGNGTNDPALLGKIGPDGAGYCLDPTSTAKGQHAYPYNYQLWAYDLNDLAAVRAGTKLPWDVKPYGVWPFSLPFPEPEVRIGGVGYDASRQIIYISQLYADKDGYGYRPIIHALKVGGGAVGAPLPVPDTSALPPLPSPTPASSWAASAVTLVANKPAPQAAGTTVTLTATPTGGAAPHQFKWLVHDGAQWSAATGWSTSNSFAWSPAAGNPNYRIGIWVKSAGNNNDQAEATASMDYAISGGTSSAPPATSPGPASGAKLTAVALATDKPAPQPANTTIRVIASPNGGAAPQQYKWLLHNGASWQVISEWTTSNAFNWTPSAANGAYRLGVWVRGAGNTADAGEATMSIDYPVSAATTATPPPTPPPTTAAAKLSAVALTTNKPAPQPANTTITLTATPNGGATPQQYKWLLHNGAAWQVISEWTTANTFNWTPSAANGAYRLGVWVRGAGNTVDAGEATMSIDFPVSAPTTSTPTPPPPTTTTAAKLSAVALSANRPAPQPANTTITFTATPNGGATPQQYKWLLHNGAAWQVISDWTTSNTFNWTPSAANAAYRFGVWVRSAGNTVDAGEATASIDFPIGGSAPGAPPPPPPPPSSTTTTAKLSAVTLGADKIAPQPVGTTIQFTAVANGGAAPLQYKWLMHNGTTWKVIGEWSTSNTFNWTPVAWNPQARVGVWVRSAGNTVDAGEVTASIDYPVSPPTATSVVSQPTTAATMTSSKSAPQAPGTAIMFTAVAVGGTGPHQYKFLVHDGAKWTHMTPWSVGNTFNWTPPTANAAYRVGVWVRSAGVTVDAPQASASIDFPIK